MFLSTLEHFLESFFQNGEQLLCQIFLDLVKCVETASFQGRLQLRKQKKVHRSQIWRVEWLGYNGHFVFRQKIVHKERRVSWCIVVVQHPTLVRPQRRPLLAYGFPQMLQNCYVTSGISPIVKRQFWRIKSRTASMWTSSVDMEGRPLQGSLSIDVLPVLKWLYHSKHCVQLIHLSLKVC